MLRAFATVVLFHSALVSATLCSSSAAAQSKEFPYEAKVVAEETYARSGAGDAYYPTQKLSRDTVVIVHRHDPGGWYMIDPPEGSFSWIPERYVKRLSDTEGEITEENVPAWVGSEFGDETSVFQRRLKTGEKITILGQKQIDTTSGLQTMLKVVPPSRERRWIPGAAVVPVDESLRTKQNADPFKMPGNAKRPDVALVSPRQINTVGTGINNSGVVDVPPIGPSSQLAALSSLRQDQQQLAAIDRRFREMILQDAAGWNLDEIENQYRALQQSSTHKPISGQIDMRYPAIERYRRRLVALTEMKEVTAQTDIRDASLLARHSPNTFETRSPVIASAGPETMIPPGEPTELSAAFDTFLNRDVSNIATSNEPVPAMTSTAPGVTTESAPEQTTAEVIAPGSPQNRFVGAGIVQKVSDGSALSGYVLMTPGGKILADLKPTGNVRLEDFVGQQVGIQGSRWSEKEKRDIIEVSALESVRIRQ